jgi:hypothetical protein
MSSSPDPEVLNCGLALATAFGKNWLRPIQERLSERYPALSPSQLNECDATCRNAMKYAHALVPRVVATLDTLDQRAYAQFRDRLTERYPWMSEDNIERLFSQGCYYAMK